MRIDVHLNQRVLVLENGNATKWLGPGRHLVFGWGRKIDIRRFSASEVIAEISDSEMKVVASGDAQVLLLGELERAVVKVSGRATKWLNEGRYVVLTFGRKVEVETFDVDVLDAPLLPRGTANVASVSDYRQVTVPAGCVALRFVDGVLDAELGPGRHAVWTVAQAVNVNVIDMRERLLAITGQEVMTKDRVSLRLNVSAEVRVVDAKRLALTAKDADASVYLAVQMASRELVAQHSLDELLRERDALTQLLNDDVRKRAEKVGIEVIRVGLKDIVLPGEMRVLLNRVIEARKEAEANVIRRREEVAATKALAQSAVILAENPVLMRLKELEAYTELAQQVGEVHVVLAGAGDKALQLQLGSG